MAAKKAIICTNIGSNMTVVEHKKEALIVESKNSIQLKDSIKLLIENEELRNELERAVYNKFNGKFTKNVMLKKYFDFYKNQVKLSEIK